MAKTESAMLTLEELKAENAETETEDQPIPQEVETEEEVDAVDEETEEANGVAEPTEEETEESETEDWMKPDGHTSDGAEKKFTDSDIGKAKAKIRAKLERKNDENEQLKARIAELEKPKTQPGELNRPKREDFYESDDPDEAYFEALTDYKVKKANAERDAKRANEELSEKQQQVKQQTEQAVEKHYEAAVKLSEKTGISAEAYQNADYQVRQMVDTIFPGSGDVVTDAFISKLGDGSEKVFYSLGVNAERRAKFKALLQDDTSGIAAGIYLGELKKDLIAPKKRKTTAPEPSTQLKGDAKLTESSSALKKKYDAAHKNGKFSDAFNLKLQAKNSGADTSNW